MNDFVNFVDGLLGSLIAQNRRNANETGPGGGINNTPVPPPTPLEFHQQMADKVNYSMLPGWSIAKSEADRIMRNADNTYISYYAGWVTVDLYPDAPANMVAWQKAARAAAPTDPLVSVDFKTLDQRVAQLEAQVKALETA